MILKFVILLFTALSVLLNVANAASLNGELMMGKNIHWNNAYESDGNIVPMEFSLPAGNPSSVQWRPLFRSTSTNVTLSNGSDAIELDVSVRGVEFDVGNFRPLTSVKEPSCALSSISGSIVTLMDSGGSECYLNSVLIQSRPSTIFRFIRPLISLSSNDLKAKFQGKPDGVYVGAVNFQYGFVYKSTTNQDIYQTRVGNIILRLNFKQGTISSIYIEPVAPISPTYKNNVASGETLIGGSVSGYFYNGVKVDLINSTRTYALKSVSDSDGSQIKYDVGCVQGCSGDTIIIENGIAKNSSFNLIGSENNIPFALRFSYQVDLSELKDAGLYNDTFTLMFQVAL